MIKKAVLNYCFDTYDFPIYKNTEVTYFSCGEEKFEALASV